VAEHAPEHDLVDLDDSEPVVLTGSPDALRGTLPLRNRSERRVVLRDVAVVDSKDAVGLRQGGGRFATTVLRPQQARTLPVSLAIDAKTPPGEYRLALQVAGRERELLVHVVETIAVDVAPNPLVIENRARKAEKAIVVTNGGNVPIAVGELGAVVLDDELLSCRSLRATAAALGDTENDEGVTIARMLTQLSREFKKSFDSAGRLRVRNKTGPVELQPGELARLALEIEVPETLDPRTRYFGRIAIYNTDLELVIVPFRAADETPATSAPRGRRTTTRRSTG
jgi:hypothetical protein